MLVKCINNYGVENHLTIGEIYSVSDSFTTINKYGLVDDEGNINIFLKSRFEILKDEEINSKEQNVDYSEVIKSLNTIKQVCIETKECSKCIFGSGCNRCILIENIPEDWNILEEPLVKVVIG